MIEAILFDLGDTLVHVDKPKPSALLEQAGRSAHQWLHQTGHRPPALSSYVRRIKWQVLRAYLWSRLRRRELQLTRAVSTCHDRMGIRLTPDQLTGLGSLCVSTLREVFRPDPESADLLRGLHDSGFKLALVSNTVFPGFVIDDYLGGEGLLDLLPVRVYSSEVRYMKPDPRIFHIALNHLGVPPARAMFIGDRTDNDVRGAARLGMKTALLARNGRIIPSGARPDYLIRRLSEVPALLQPHPD